LFKQRLTQYTLNDLVVTFEGKALLYPRWFSIYHTKPPVDLLTAVVYDDYDRKGESESKGDDFWTPRYMSQIFGFFQEFGIYSDEILEEYADDSQALLEGKIQLKDLIEPLTQKEINRLTKSDAIREINKFLFPFFQKGEILDKFFSSRLKTYYQAYLRFKERKIPPSQYFDVLLFLFLELSADVTIEKMEEEEFKQHRNSIYNLALKEGFIQAIPPYEKLDEIKTAEYYTEREKNKELRRKKHQDYGERIQTAFSYVSRGEMEKARQLYLDIIEEDPHNFDAWDGLGALNTRESQLTEASKCFQQALVKNSRKITVMAKLGYTYMHLKQFDKAIAILIKAIDYNSFFHKSWLLDIGEAWLSLAQMYSNLGSELEAKNAGENALQLYENHPELIMDDPPEILQFFCSSGRLQKATFLKQELNRRPMKPKPDDLHVLERRIDILSNLGRKEEAKSLWEKGKQISEQQRGDIT
jgi:Tfp pilus assembly protein PilF